MNLIKVYKKWCKNKGYKPSNGKMLKEFIKLIQN